MIKYFSSLVKDTIFLHDITTRLLVKKYITNSGKILTLAFNSEGTILASSSLDSILKIWDVVLGTELKSYSLKTETPLYSISFAKGDTILKCFSNYHVYLFNINSGTLKSIHEIERSNPAIFNPNEYHPQPSERTAQASSSRLENLADTNLVPVNLNK